MKTKTLSLSLAALAALPGMALAQGSFLSDPTNGAHHALIVAPGGNIGIGTSTPQEALAVEGNVSLIGNLTFGSTVGQVLNLYSPTPYYGIGVQANRVYFRSGSGFSWFYRGEHSNQDNDPGPGGNRLMDLDYAGNLSVANFIIAPKLSIGGSTLVVGAGNVGIGTGSPRRKLDVYGTMSVSGDGPPRGDGFFLEFGGVSGGYKWIQSYGNQPLVVNPLGNNVGIGTTLPQANLDVVGNAAFSGKVNCTVLELTSDRAVKSGFAPVDNRELLEKVAHLPISTWHYTNAPGVRHIGPMAQDFQAAFNVGSDDRHIATVDADGVALAAIQGLNEKLTESIKEKDTEIAALRNELRALKTDQTNFVARFEKLEKLLVAGLSEKSQETLALTLPPRRESSDHAESSHPFADAR